ncbi:plasmid SOS inhibition protein A [Cedecea sp. NFIX57]|uniref:plasmid SOS inhibition protein A n=1 Tax=Cedecea sp. NFIX57 TaxID=1566286 RepID=UPI000A0AC0E6|nr:plasmid SOS inhibition protein A [Cedecea sp. NFIX57]SMG61996.1 PsiA protein [Cedecea sp. NFIX57]
MIPSHMSLVPLSPERRAAMQAIADVERRRDSGAAGADFPYARAFFKHLRGSKRLTLNEIRLFAPVLSEQELRGNRDSWLRAIDTLIESRGAGCYLPLPAGAGYRLFPEVAFQKTERRRRQDELQDEKYTRQRHREACLRERAYQARVGQAETELAFHTPATVASWSARWSDTLPPYALEAMFFRWSERFPSLSGLERWAFEGEPLWVLIREAGQLACEALPQVAALERWMVSNKLVHQAGGVSRG